MRYQLAYPLLDAPPFIPRRLLALRFEAKVGPPTQEGCRIWQAATTPRGDGGTQVGKMRLKSPKGSVLVTAPKVAWYLAGHPWPDDETYLARTCGQALCCEAAHLEPRAKVDRRRMSVAQVLECRELYWGQKTRHAGLRATSPLEEASRTLGITVETVRRVVDGKRVTPTSWNNWELTTQQVKEAVEDARLVIDQIRCDKETVWTHSRLASRYATDPTTVRRVLDGFLYKDAPGPTSAQEAQEARAQAHRAEARRARQASQGDPTIRARQAS